MRFIMTHVTRAVDLFLGAVRRNKLLGHAQDEEDARVLTEYRDHALKRFRKAMGNVTQEKFLAARWGHTPMKQRLKQWEEMVSVSNDPPKWPTL
jgi:hypothetical protein